VYILTYTYTHTHTHTHTAIDKQTLLILMKIQCIGLILSFLVLIMNSLLNLCSPQVCKYSKFSSKSFILIASPHKCSIYLKSFSCVVWYQGQSSLFPLYLWFLFLFIFSCALFNAHHPVTSSPHPPPFPQPCLFPGVKFILMENWI